MDIGKTDRRFVLHKFGFEYFVEFDFPASLFEYQRTKKVCKEVLGDEFVRRNLMIIRQGDWHSTLHQYKHRAETRRIYFKTRDHYLYVKLSQNAVTA